MLVPWAPTNMLSRKKPHSTRTLLIIDVVLFFTATICSPSRNSPLISSTLSVASAIAVLTTRIARSRKEFVHLTLSN